MNSAQCKQLIVQYCNNHQNQICAEFDPPLTNNNFQNCLNIDNWKRMYKQRRAYYLAHPNCWERGFDCVSFNAQLRGYVITDSQDQSVIAIYVQGE